MQTQTIVHDLLVEYQRLNQQVLLKVQQEMNTPISETRTQIIEPPSDVAGRKICTFDKRRPRSLTAMLQARFAYAGSWKMAEAGHEWLSLRQIESAMDDVKIHQRLEEVIKFAFGTPLKGVLLSNISLFGLHHLQGEEIYLIWPDHDLGEPKVVSYAGNDERIYENFKEYLSYLINGYKMCLKKQSSSNEMPGE